MDAGGTFTDAVLERPDGSLSFHKRPSTPRRPAEAVLAAVEALDPAEPVGRVAHGSTVATNAFLEKASAPVGLITVAGLEDVVSIGRQRRRHLYHLRPEGPRRIVPPDRIRGISARIGADGEAIEGLEEEELLAAAAGLREAGAEVLVLGLLHSAQHPEQERRAAAALEARGLPVIASHRVTPEPREHERWTTALVAAGLAPIVRGYVERLEEELPADDLRIMMSNGGLATAAQVSERPLGTILSGPAAGVIGARLVARAAGLEEIVTLDMGGTSCDVAVVPGEVERTIETELDGVPLRVPMVDIQTVGAGGGSIARVDRAGALVVGPESAGADPGPACYGAGGEGATVTDAHLVLGRLDPERFLGGRRALDVEAARAAVGRVADGLGAGLEETAAAILAVARSHLERAVRRVTLERGHDPADFSLVAFGGAGGLQAAELADGLGVRRVLVPRAAGVLSALGCLAADTRLDFARTILEPASSWSLERLEEVFAELEESADAALEREGVEPEDRETRRSIEMRYRGQSFETTVPLPLGEGRDLERVFHERHERRYGYARPGSPTEIVTVRIAALGLSSPPSLPDHEWTEAEDPADRSIGLEDGESIEARAWAWDALPAGYESGEPALVLGEHATVVVPPGWWWRVGRRGDLVLESGE
ncbi:MAG: hydantoinase/oxoprolinase family protein [Gemmatimonadota bacterium]|nr:hydantoinase/oxoprolinase family protein [Gemmatimonadota bacterium]